MIVQKIKIGNIPTIVWGEKSDRVYIHVHGKMSCKEYAESFAKIAEYRGYQTISFDLPEHGERNDNDYRCDIWNGIHDLSTIADYTFSIWKNVSLYASSLGAYFSLNTYADKNFTKCLFQSPILSMEYLINQMFIWFDVTEERLYIEKEIQTPIDTLSWEYYQYVKEQPIKRWSIPTSILYGGKDNLQSIDVIQEFVKAHGCKLTISQSSEHPFMENEDMKIVHEWLVENI